MKLKKKFLPGILIGVSLLLLIVMLLCVETYRSRYTPYTGSHPTILAFAREHGLEPGDWPEDLVGLLDSNPEAEDFVLNYPLEHGKTHSIDLSGLLDSEGIPLLLQWDKRWGYDRYGDGLMGQTGCGPTCLSMVCLYLLQDASLDPGTVAEFSSRNGYCVPGNGSSWTLISEGSEKLGLDVEQIPLVEGIITGNLEEGNPIICVMGPGDFTSSGHYIVLTGYENGLLRVNDPNSPLRSQKLWDFDDIQDQFRNLWVCKAP